MNADFYTRFISRVTYKPGVKLSLTFDRNSLMVEFRTVEMVSDATRKEPGLIPLHFREVRPESHFQGEDDLMRWIHHCLVRRERHEVDEWFQLDGVAPFYPH